MYTYFAVSIFFITAYLGNLSRRDRGKPSSAIGRHITALLRRPKAQIIIIFCDWCACVRMVCASRLLTSERLNTDCCVILCLVRQSLMGLHVGIPGGGSGCET